MVTLEQKEKMDRVATLASNIQLFAESIRDQQTFSIKDGDVNYRDLDPKTQELFVWGIISRAEEISELANTLPHKPGIHSIEPNGREKDKFYRYTATDYKGSPFISVPARNDEEAYQRIKSSLGKRGREDVYRKWEKAGFLVQRSQTYNMDVAVNE